MKNVISDKKRIHFIGVGGISMSGLAEILLNENFMQKPRNKHFCWKLFSRLFSYCGEQEEIIYLSSFTIKCPAKNI